MKMLIIKEVGQAIQEADYEPTASVMNESMVEEKFDIPNILHSESIYLGKSMVEGQRTIEEEIKDEINNLRETIEPSKLIDMEVDDIIANIENNRIRASIIESKSPKDLLDRSLSRKANSDVGPEVQNEMLDDYLISESVQ